MNINLTKELWATVDRKALQNVAKQSINLAIEPDLISSSMIAVSNSEIGPLPEEFQKYLEDVPIEEEQTEDSKPEPEQESESKPEEESKETVTKESASQAQSQSHHRGGRDRDTHEDISSKFRYANVNSNNDEFQAIA